ncbi:hypothetical protein GCM10027203_73350 [Nonomuraea fastidiosa]
MTPMSPSSAATPPEKTVISVSQPPDESPAIAKRFGSSPYVAAFARSHRMAALMSCTWAGKVAWALLRTLTPATAKPSGPKTSAIASAPSLPSSLLQAEPVCQMSSGLGVVPASGR